MTCATCRSTAVVTMRGRRTHLYISTCPNCGATVRCSPEPPDAASTERPPLVMFHTPSPFVRFDRPFAATSVRDAIKRQRSLRSTTPAPPDARMRQAGDGRE